MLKEQIQHLDRIEAGSQISLQSLDGSQSSDGTGWHRIIVPILIGILYLILVMSCWWLPIAVAGRRKNKPDHGNHDHVNDAQPVDDR